MAKRIRYPNAQILKGVHSRVLPLRSVKRTIAGVVSTAAAPVVAQTKVVPASPTVYTWSPTFGIGTTGACGRNWIKGKAFCIGTGNQTVKLGVKTPAGTKMFGTAGPVATTVTKVATTTRPICGTLVIKGIGAGKITQLKYATLKVNDVTTEMM